jgi:hypothetical protein
MSVQTHVSPPITEAVKGQRAEPHNHHNKQQHFKEYT